VETHSQAQPLGRRLSCSNCRLGIITERLMLICPRCHASLVGAKDIDDTLPEGYRVAAICRKNLCGHYRPESDACQLVIDTGKAKNINRPGKIEWLEAGGFAAQCPASPPQWVMETPVARIGFLSPVFNHIGGTETWHKTLLPHIDQAGFVSLATTTSDLSALRCWARRGESAAKRLAASVEVLVVWGVGSQLGKYLPSGRRPKVITVTHTNCNSDWGREIVAGQCPWSDAVVAVNHSGLISIPATWQGLRRVIFNAVDLNRVRSELTQAEAKERLGITPQTKVIMSISRISPEKRLDLLARAARHLPDDYRVVIVGVTSGPDLDHTRELLAMQSDRFTLLPAVDAPGDVLRAADCYVSCSQFEGFGLSAAEAVAAEVPVISTAVGVFEDFPHLATLIPHAVDAQTLADTIVCTCRRPPETFERSQQVKSRFSVSRFVDDWKTIIAEITGHE
jgi:glycosyltransferase involved in cell wall biosynthesis